MKENRYLIATMAGILMFLTGLSVWWFGNWFFIVPIYIYLTGKLHENLLLDLWLARSLVAILIIPILLLTREALSHKWERQRVGIVGLSLVFSMVCLCMFLHTQENLFFNPQTGEAVKYYAETPEGIRFFDQEGFDPKYGIELKPVTQELMNKLNMEKRYEKARSASQLREENNNTGSVSQVWQNRPTAVSTPREEWRTIFSANLSENEWTENIELPMASRWRITKYGDIYVKSLEDKALYFDNDCGIELPKKWTHPPKPICFKGSGKIQILVKDL